MMKKILLCLCLLIGSMAMKAQCGAVNNAIKPGESLSYELKFNWKFIWFNVGWAKMTVNEDTYNAQPCLRTDLLSYTNKRFDRWFKMRDTLTCITSPRLEPLYEMDVCVYDMLSILLQARSYDPTDYKVGMKILFSMATGKAVEKQTLIYRGKENFTSENGTTYRCLVFSLVEYVDNKEKEVITFFVTDDLNHLPVRLDMYLNFGSAKAFLTDIKGNRHPLTSIVEKK